ncbi:hypothetical protein WG66_006172 [Moniliophthora roreri]|nr:hypothetical protein WG66_006172 [Moniliophthora roreri]
MNALFLLTLLLPFTKNVSQAQETAQTALSLQSTDFVNPLIGTTGPIPDSSGGMIPSVSYPFGTVRWVVQNQKNFVSATPFNYSTSDKVHGFIGTRQPAGENAPIGIVPGISTGTEAVKTDWDARAMDKVADSEEFGIGHYAVRLDGGNDTTIQVNMSATSKAAHFVFNFTIYDAKANVRPYIWIPVARESVKYYPGDIYEPYFPNGTVNIVSLKAGIEICGSSDEFDDLMLVPISVQLNARNFRGWFCARFNFTTSGGYDYGVTQGKGIHEGALEGQGTELGAYVRFPSNVTWVEVRIGTSMISASQARYNLEDEIPEGQAIDDTRRMANTKWAEKLGRFEVETTAEDVKMIFYTSVWRGMQYPYEVAESSSDSKKHYYSAFTNSVHEGESYSGYSIWDTYRATWALQLLFAPERIPGMVRSMLHDFNEGGWLPMWKNIAETNIMVGTHADSLLGEAVRKGFDEMVFSDTELHTIWDAVWKDCTVPPVNDSTTRYTDRQTGVDFEVRAGLSTFYDDEGRGWVADDIHSESASRTLDYAYDDHAAYVLSAHLPPRITSSTTFPNGTAVANVTQFLKIRAMNRPWVLWNDDASSDSGTKGFVEAKLSNGSWSGSLSIACSGFFLTNTRKPPGPTNGFTEGDRFVYSLSMVHAIPELIRRRGGSAAFVASLDEFFEGGKVDFRNEPSHHTPYLYTLAGAPEKSAHWIREMARKNYNNTPNGLSGNEDCGQMSAWYIWSAMGFYPVNPVSGEYVVGSPFFSKMTIQIPVPPFIGRDHTGVPIMDPFNTYNNSTDSYVLRISARGAEENIFVKSLTVNGRRLGGTNGSTEWVIRHEEIMFGGVIEYEMVGQT